MSEHPAPGRRRQRQQYVHDAADHPGNLVRQLRLRQGRHRRRTDRHLDDPPGTGIPLPAGLTNREALLLMEEMHHLGLVRSAEFVEVNPVLDVRNQTATMACELIARLLGHEIY